MLGFNLKKASRDYPGVPITGKAQGPENRRTEITEPVIPGKHSKLKEYK